MSVLRYGVEDRQECLSYLMPLDFMPVARELVRP